MSEEKYTRSEELANAISHFSAALLAVAGLVLMIIFSATRGSGWHVVSTSIFGITMIILYLCSGFTHLLPPGNRKEFFFQMDRISIYFLIAGTYTPIALVLLHGPLGWVIFGLEWGMALTGTILVARLKGDYNSGVNSYFVFSYAAMGWLILIAIVPVIRSLPLMGSVWILAGGISYTLGILFYKIARFRFHHLVWHLLVITGSLSHFFAIFFYIIPR